jgi:hypothetical protein
VPLIGAGYRHRAALDLTSSYRQARLDVLDGYCLVLITHVLGARRGVAWRTRKVRKPSLIRLRSYFQGRFREDDDEPAPTPPGA